MSLTAIAAPPTWKIRYGPTLLTATQLFPLEGDAGSIPVSEAPSKITIVFHIANGDTHLKKIIEFTTENINQLVFENNSKDNSDCKIETIIEESNLPYRHFPRASVDLSPNADCTFTARIENNSLYTLKLQILSPEMLHKRLIKDMAVFTSYFSIVVTLALLFLLISLFTADKMYLAYSIYSICFALMIIFIEDLLPWSVRVSLGRARFQFAHIAACFTWFFFIEFSKRYLALDSSRVRSLALIRTLQGLFLAQMIFGILSPQGPSQITGGILTALSMLSINILSLFQIKRSNNAKFYTLSTAFTLALVLLFNMQAFGHPVSSVFLEYPAASISILEIFSLAIGLSAHIYGLNRSLLVRNEELTKVGKVLELEVQAKDEANRQLAEQHQLMIETERLRVMGEMAATVVHEIKNPIFSMQIRIEHMSKSLEFGNIDKGQLIASLNKTRHSFDKINKIVQSITQLSRNEVNVPFEKIDLKELLSESIDLIHGKIMLASVDLRKPFLTSDHAEALVRPSQIIQIVINLISNAVDAVKDTDERWIEVSLENHESHFEIHVRNGGKKIPEEFAFNLENTFSTKGRKAGAGLGLRVSRALAEQHHGSLFVQREDNFTNFVLKIPHPTDETLVQEGLSS